MIIVEAAGGLGNQLQQYALYRKFRSLGREAKLDISWFDKENQKKMPAKRELELNYFEGLTYEICTPKEKAALAGSGGLSGKIRRKFLPFTVRHFYEKEMYCPKLLDFENCYLSGYFACEKYYRDILDVLRREIRFPESRNPHNKQMAQEMKECEAVSVHIRRGDYLDAENKAMFGNICTDAYYEKALEVVRRKAPKARFYLFSDDISYAKEKYQGEEFTVVDINRGKDSFYDMWLMSCCKHNICANSTFSFWGARLNGNKEKIMIRPTIHKNTQKFDKQEMEDLWQGWHFVSPEGKAW